MTGFVFLSRVGPVGTAVCVYRADNDAFNNGIFDVFREDIRNVTRDPVTGAVTTSDIQNMFLEVHVGPPIYIAYTF